jgi:hypothetical protein
MAKQALNRLYISALADKKVCEAMAEIVESGSLPCGGLPRARKPKPGVPELPEIGGRPGVKISRREPALSPQGNRATLRCENA